MAPPRKRSSKPNIGQLQVRLANENNDPLDQLVELSMCRFQSAGLDLNISRCWASETPTEVRQFLFDLTQKNMRELYEQSNWGWNESQKRKELTGKTSQYLLVTDPARSDSVVAFVHFRFDMDFDIPVLYCYEIQLVTEMQRKGIGAHLMEILQKLAERFRMNKVILTVFKHNTQALDFYTKKLHFRTDPTDPKENHIDFTILSKKVDKLKTK